MNRSDVSLPNRMLVHITGRGKLWLFRGTNALLDTPFGFTIILREGRKARADRTQTKAYSDNYKLSRQFQTFNTVVDCQKQSKTVNTTADCQHR